MKKKGFTLIELLAVIVILAIIALIAIPLIGNVIEKAKIGALENSVNGLVESANMYYANQSIKGEQQTETIFDFANGEQTNSQKLEYKGKVYNGKLILHANGKVAVCIDDKEHYAYKNKDSDEIISGVGTCLYDGPTGDFSSNSPVEDIKKQVAAATATSDKVLEGSTIYTLSGLVAGTMANNANKQVNVTNISEVDDNAVITIPKGYYDENSEIVISKSQIQNSLTLGGVYYLGTGTSFNISDIPGYENLTADNFIVGVSASNSIRASGSDSNKNYANCQYNNFSLSKSYNNTTGVLTIGGNSYSITACCSSGNSNFCADGAASGSVSPFVYLVVGTIENH